MKDYTLNQGAVSREAEDILDYVGTPRGWNAQHFKVYKGQLYWEPGAILGETEWTERQLDIHRIAVEGYLVLQEAFRLHQAVIDARDWDAVAFTLEQLHTTTFMVFATAVERMREITTGSTNARESGRKARGVKRESGHDWDAICDHYDKLMSEGKKRYTVTHKLSQKYDIRKDDLNRGLRNRGRGSNKGGH